MTEPTPLPAASGEPRALPRELTEFLIELAIALQKFAIYPASHPMLATTVERLQAKLLPLLTERETLSLGIARNQLVIEGVATPEGHAVLRDLAERLHHHHLGAMKIVRGVSGEELREVLTVIGTDQGKDAVPLGLRPQEELPYWAHVQLYPLAYEHLELLDEDQSRASAPAPSARGRTDGARAARLWVGLARAALAGQGSAPPTAADRTSGATAARDDSASPAGHAASEAELAESAADPLAVARAIDEHQREAAYDQVIVGYLLQIANELKTADSRDAGVLRGRISRMVGAMKPETLRTLLAMGGDETQRHRFVLDATQGMAVDAVVELVRAAGEASQQTVSHSMLRLLSKLAVHAEQDAPARRADADAALRENVRTLVSHWTLENPNPGAYGAVLEGMSRARPASIATQPAHPVDEERLFQMALEIGVWGESTWRSMEGMISRGRLAQVLSLLERAPMPRIAQQAWERLATTDRLRTLLAAPAPDWLSLERLTVKLGLAAADTLLDDLESATDARRQAHLVSLLARLGDDAGAAAVRRLPRATPEMQAQLLALLGRLATLPADFSPVEWAKHRNVAVRREATKLLLRDPATREQGIQLGVVDVDERTVLLALNEVIANGCPRPALPLLMNRVDRGDIPAPLRALAIRAAGGASSPDVVEWVLRFVMSGRVLFFGPQRLAPKTPELLAAIATLATHWRGDARAAAALALASGHADQEIRAAATVHLRAPSSAPPAVEGDA